MTHMAETKRDHGGGLDAACAAYGGGRSDWLDLSTGINPQPYPLPDLSPDMWAALPDKAAQDRLIAAARKFWNVPQGLEVVAAPGTSALIAQMPSLRPAGRVHIQTPTYNEHAAAFVAQGWQVVDDAPAEARVIVHPNNPTGALFAGDDLGVQGLTVLDESFADIVPQASLVALAQRPSVVVLKSFGKFWGLAGLRLGFAICRPDTAAKLRDRIGPWAVSGPALHIGATALQDQVWAAQTRARLYRDAEQMDALLAEVGVSCIGGTPLFRLYKTKDAKAAQTHLAEHMIWSRIFPYSDRWLRLGLPGTDADWARLRDAVRGLK